MTGNGAVDRADAQAIKKRAIGASPANFAVPGNCDVNGDGACNAHDANAIELVSLGLPSPSFGQHCPNADPSTPCAYCR